MIRWPTLLARAHIANEQGLPQGQEDILLKLLAS